MKYPVTIPEHISADGFPLQLYAPTELVQQASQYLPANSRILDVGAYTGTNGYYLAEQGHTVDSIEIDESYISDGEIIRRYLGSFAMNNHFINADIAGFAPGADYDAAIATKILQSLYDKQDAMNVLGKISQAVKPGGLNVVWAYIAKEEELNEAGSLTLLQPGELEEFYKKQGWKILSYSERMKPLRRVFNPGARRYESRVGSSAELIARKPQRPALEKNYQSYIAALEKLSPDRARVLRGET